jgi:hypothetical protein
MSDQTTEFTEPGFHSAARAPFDSKPAIEITHEEAPCLFAIDFGAGMKAVERVLMTVESAGTRNLPGILREASSSLRG